MDVSAPAIKILSEEEDAKVKENARTILQNER